MQDYGVEICPICKKLEAVKVKFQSGVEIKLYSTHEIRVPSVNEQKIYAASDFILHYVVFHHYKPPQEFIDAVLVAPLPGTPEYDSFVAPWQNTIDHN